MARFRLRFNQYNFDIKLNEEGRRGFKQEKLIENFFLLSHTGTHKGIKVQVTGHWDPNDQEARENVWISYPQSEDLNQNRALKY